MGEGAGEYRWGIWNFVLFQFSLNWPSLLACAVLITFTLGCTKMTKYLQKNLSRLQVLGSFRFCFAFFLLHFLLVLLIRPVQLLQMTLRDVLILVWALLCFSRTNQTGSSSSNTFSNMQSGYSSGNYNRYWNSGTVALCTGGRLGLQVRDLVCFCQMSVVHRSPYAVFVNAVCNESFIFLCFLICSERWS